MKHNTVEHIPGYESLLYAIIARAIRDHDALWLWELAQDTGMLLGVPVMYAGNALTFRCNGFEVTVEHREQTWDQMEKDARAVATGTVALAAP